MEQNSNLTSLNKKKQELVNYAVTHNFSNVLVRNIRECDNEHTLDLLANLKKEDNFNELNAGYIFYYE